MKLTDKQLEKAARIFVDLEFCDVWAIDENDHCVIGWELDDTVDGEIFELVDPLNSTDQRDALLEWLNISVYKMNHKDGGGWYARRERLLPPHEPDCFKKTRKEAENACLIACLEEE